jgi:hypothetical protein
MDGNQRQRQLISEKGSLETESERLLMYSCSYTKCATTTAEKEDEYNSG